MNNRTNLLYFERKDGGYYTNDQIETAYYISTGKHRHENEKEYMLFLNKIFGKSITKAVIPDPIEFLEKGWRLFACRQYANMNGCSIGEARNILKEYPEWYGGYV